MAIVVRHRETGERYVLLGTGSSAWSAMRGTFHSGGKGQLHMVAVCDHLGTVSWFLSKLIEVEEIDGVHPREILESAQSASSS